MATREVRLEGLKNPDALEYSAGIPDTAISAVDFKEKLVNSPVETPVDTHDAHENSESQPSSGSTAIDEHTAEPTSTVSKLDSNITSLIEGVDVNKNTVKQIVDTHESNISVSTMAESINATENAQLTDKTKDMNSLDTEPLPPKTSDLGPLKTGTYEEPNEESKATTALDVDPVGTPAPPKAEFTSRETPSSPKDSNLDTSSRNTPAFASEEPSIKSQAQPKNLTAPVSKAAPSAGGQWSRYIKRAVANVEQTLEKVIQETATSELGSQSEGAPQNNEAISKEPAPSEIKIKAPKPVNATPRPGSGRLTMQERLAMALGGRNSPSMNSPSGSTRTVSPATESPGSSPRASLDFKRPPIEMNPPSTSTPTSGISEISKNAENAEKLEESKSEATPLSYSLDSIKSLVTSLPNDEIKLKLEDQLYHFPSNPPPQNASSSAELRDAQEIIDSLKSKLKFLAREEAQRAKKEKSSSSGIERKLAEKEEQVALLLEEGQILSRNELKHMNAIKALRAKERDSDRLLQEAQRRQEIAERDALQAKVFQASWQDAEKRLNEVTKARTRADNETETLKKEKQSNMVSFFVSFGIFL